MIDQFDYTQQQLAESIGKSRSHIANTLRLTALPAPVLEALQTGKLTAGHARALIATEDPQSLAQKIMALGLSVRQAEALAREGVRFTRAYATDFWTLPSHASLFTGQYPSDHGATSETNRLGDEAHTLAERLRDAGFRTGAFVSNPWMSC